MHLAPDDPWKAFYKNLAFPSGTRTYTFTTTGTRFKTITVNSQNKFDYYTGDALVWNSHNVPMPFVITKDLGSYNCVCIYDEGDGWDKPVSISYTDTAAPTWTNI